MPKSLIGRPERLPVSSLFVAAFFFFPLSFYTAGGGRKREEEMAKIESSCIPCFTFFERKTFFSLFAIVRPSRDRGRGGLPLVWREEKEKNFFREVPFLPCPLGGRHRKGEGKD